MPTGNHPAVEKIAALQIKSWPEIYKRLLSPWSMELLYDSTQPTRSCWKDAYREKLPQLPQGVGSANQNHIADHVGLLKLSIV